MNFEGEAKILSIKTKLCKRDDGTYDHGPYHIDQRLHTVECGTCGAELSAAFVLSELARADTRLYERADRLKREARDAAAMNITACEHCLKPTRIVR